ncbi:MAG TPA: BTAD domain-containing putative transcriptional regulator [Jiangellaceae bacterium]
MVEVRLLGPFELVQGGLIKELTGPAERVLLALLATAPGRVFTTERLIDELWGESLPANPGNALHLRVSKLRRTVGGAVARTPAGYRLDVDPENVDAVLFTRLIAKRAFADALALWRGAPLAEFMDYEWARTEAARLEELYATATEELVDAKLAAGEHVALVPELEQLIAAQPLRERLRSQLMVALYRCGRAADALAAYQSFRRLLNDELGIEPSPTLRQLETAILRDDPSLEVPTTVSPRTNLPAALSSLIGRDRDLHRLNDAIAHTRLVTLIGPGGVGKTTLAIAAARQTTGEYADGVWFIALASVTNGRRIPGVVAQTLRIADPDSSSLQRLVSSWLAERHVLLLLDNCEHLADPCAHFVERLLRSTGDRVHILATSREALGVPGELQIPVQPLATEEAVSLFTERAASVAPDFDPATSFEHVRRICERLDGMPLAIELAAARVKMLQPEEIAARLDDRFRLLTSGPRTAEARHKTLRATVDWSHALLSSDEQALFRRVAVFRGGWTLDAAEAVCASPAGEDVIDLLSRLVDRSLVVADAGRFRMLETINAYARELLDRSGERATLARRHALFFAEFAERAEPHLRGPHQQIWLERIRSEEPNLRQALDWARAQQDSEMALRLAGSLGWYWYVGRQIDGRSYISAALDVPGPGSDAARARALQALSLAVRPVGCIVHPTPEGARAAEESLVLFRRAEDEPSAAISQLLAAVEGVAAKDSDRYVGMVNQARSTLRSYGDDWGVALGDFVEMEIRLHHGQVAAALAFGHEAARAFDTLDDDWGRSAVMLHLGYGLRLAGRVDEAEDILHRAVVLSRAGGLPNNLARSFVELGEARLYRGDATGALEWFAECETVARDLGNDTLMALAALGRGAASRLQGHISEAEGHHQQALALSTGTAFGKGVLRARIGLAAARLDTGVTAQVASELREARTSAEAIGDDGLIVAAIEQLARAAALSGDTDAFQALLAEAGGRRSATARPRGALDRRDVVDPRAREAHRA